MCGKVMMLTDVPLSLSCGSCSCKHEHTHGQNLPVSVGTLWWRGVTVNGDPASIWPGAKSGEKPGAALPRSSFFFYLFSLPSSPVFPLPGCSLKRCPPAQPNEWERHSPQQQPTTLQTQTLPHFASTVPPHLQQVCFFSLPASGWLCSGIYVFFSLRLLRSSTPAKPPSSASSVASSSMRPPTPSTSVSLPYNRGSGSSGPLRPPSRANSGSFFTSSPGLPPPPPLLPPANSTAAGTENRLATFHCCFSLLGWFISLEEHGGS